MSTTSTAADSGLADRLTAVLSATTTAAQRLADDLQRAAESAWSTPACGSWTVDQTVGHLVLGPVAYLEIIDQVAAGTQTPLFDPTDESFAEAQLTMMGEATPDERIDGLVSSFALFTDAAADLDENVLDATTWTPEATMPVLDALAIGLNELAVHGFEVREAAGLPHAVDAPEMDALAGWALHAVTGLVRGGTWGPIGLTVGGRGVVVRPSESGAVVEAATPGTRTAVTVRCSPAVLSLVSWGRLTFEEAEARGWVVVDGNREALAGFSDCVHAF